MTNQTSGYSGTPLAKKLGVKSGFTLCLINEPSNYFDLFTDFPNDCRLVSDDGVKKDFIHLFTKHKSEFIDLLPRLKAQLKPAGIIWVSWPKKASKVSADITEDIIRNYAISIGLVDIKVCAVNEVWSGLKLVIPVKDRPAE
ncbi:DUF3052 domain-containing protein [Mucilaginibacter sp. UR6-11]|uniref:DUF3052 domain-containing protein n=1 Tax=Mucilaginibacter sp. UR6-11 TaxID=1435644 RepID=UPI001E4DC4BE|nr:DUF3052 domain-containing protein [Mucilaginibacter sp. UR6-11]MCC8426114.1 DUF3052 domain-containing protein [Mucilaginibacter sp. UR6-11]